MRIQLLICARKYQLLEYKIDTTALNQIKPVSHTADPDSQL